jgi:hypothetical protein
MWNRIVELESAIEARPKSAQAGREIAKFLFLKAMVVEHGFSPKTTLPEATTCSFPNPNASANAATDA